MIKERFDLCDKTALVVGGRGFLGRRFASALDEFGARVYAADLTNPSPAARKDETAINRESNTVRQLDVDVTDEESVRVLVKQVADDSGQIDILVYAATTKPKDFYESFTESSLLGWQSVLRVELDGLFLVTREVGKMMEQARSGSIILLSSIYGIVGNDQRIYEDSNLPGLYADSESDEPRRIFSHAVYPAAKGGVIALTRFLAAYWGAVGIRVNCISPGGLAHPGENEEFIRKYSARVPLGHKAAVDDVSGAVVFLASAAAQYITGHNLVVDGGWTAW
jgi:Dehydrogenases with different specificities (related to short-chain alcohol dehydrogenases)